jgi:hypothetical protein
MLIMSSFHEKVSIVLILKDYVTLYIPCTYNQTLIYHKFAIKLFKCLKLILKLDESTKNIFY